MDYIDLIKSLAEKGYTRVERDDRLLDVFPKEITEKGIQLWERWDKENISLVRLHLPFRPKFVRFYKLPRAKIEKALYENEIKSLSRFKGKNLL